MMQLVSSRRALTAVAVSGALVVAAWLALRPTRDAKASPAPVSPAAVSPAAVSPAAVSPPVVPPPPAVAGAVDEALPKPVVVAAPTPGKGSVKFPDGSMHAALNGVTDALEAPWPAGPPYSPVAQQLHDN